LRRARRARHARCDDVDVLASLNHQNIAHLYGLEKADATTALEYLSQAKGEQWRIISIVADGVSDLALKRAEY
jgi:hypothetical protein